MRTQTVFSLVLVLGFTLLFLSESAQESSANGKTTEKKKDKGKNKNSPQPVADLNGDTSKDGVNEGKKAATKAKVTINGTTGLCQMSASELDKKLQLSCSSGVIADLYFMGHNVTAGRTCEGLTPDLFVQLANCMWKKECSLTYDSKGRNYMIKIINGPNSCIIMSPGTFHYNYSCANDSAIFSLISGNSQTITELKGIMKSHPEYPWHYDHKSQGNLHSITFFAVSKQANKAFFCYTFRSLHLAHGDTLTADTGLISKNWTHDDVITPASDVRVRSGCLGGSNKVTFSLAIRPISYGAEGLVMCFSWNDVAIEGFDECADVMKPQMCKDEEEINGQNGNTTNNGEQGTKGNKGKGNKDQGNKDQGNKDQGNKGKGNKGKVNKDQGNKDQGNKDQGNKDQGNKGKGNKGKGNKGKGNKGKGNKAKGNKDQGNKDQGNKDQGDKDQGNKDQGDKDQGNKDQGNKDQGNKDQGNKDQGDKDQGNKDQGNKDQGDKDQGEQTTIQ